MTAIIPHPSADPTLRLLRSYERLGWHLAPAKGKRPIGKAWPEKALCSASQAAVWLDKGHNLALVTGSRSGIVVIDIDPRNGGADSLGAAQAEYGALPETLTSNTGGGGQHLVYRYFDGARSGKPLDGIDFQADRRCIIVPPSMHPETGALYQWASDPESTPIAELPSQWQQAMAGVKPETFADDGGPIPEGRRNQTLFDLARHLYGKGEPETLVRAQIEEANDTRCEPPLEPAEVAQIVAGAYRYRVTEASPLSLFQGAVWRWPMDSIHKLTLLALASYADTQTLKAYPTQEQIALRAGITDRHVRTVLKRLEAQDWFTRTNHRRSQGSGFNHSYQLRIPGVSQ